MRIESAAFAPGREIPTRNTCLGPNLSPSLRFLDPPPGTRVFVLVVEDADATPRPWVHWLVFDIPASTSRVAEGEVPAGGVEGLANGGDPGYEGPCPRYFQGTHHYRFLLYALDAPLRLPAASDRDAVAAAMDGRVLAVAELVGTCTSSDA